MRTELLYKLRERIIEEAEIEVDYYVTVYSNIYHNNTGIYFRSDNNETTIEVFNDENPCRDYNNVTDWLEEHLQRDDVLDELKRQIEYATEDEWEAHGFRDEADYLRYRYG